MVCVATTLVSLLALPGAGNTQQSRNMLSIAGFNLAIKRMNEKMKISNDVMNHNFGGKRDKRPGHLSTNIFHKRSTEFGA